MSTVLEPQAPNPEQAAAIDAAGTVFVSAGAGTGKTTVIVERFLRAVERGVDVNSILAITFTERAAGELRSRIRARLVETGRTDLARELDGAWISTIHGFCRRLLRSYPAAAGVDPASACSTRPGRACCDRVLRSGAGRVLPRRASRPGEAAGDLRRRRSAQDARRRRGDAAGGGAAARAGLEQEPDLDAGIARLRAAVAATLAETEGNDKTEEGRAQVARALDLIDGSPPVDLLLDLSSLR